MTPVRQYWGMKRNIVLDAFNFASKIPIYVFFSRKNYKMSHKNID